ncbi:hypothetical protein D3C75_1241860 [compost metagenome]
MALWSGLKKTDTQQWCLTKVKAAHKGLDIGIGFGLPGLQVLYCKLHLIVHPLNDLAFHHFKRSPQRFMAGY